MSEPLPSFVRPPVLDALIEVANVTLWPAVSIEIAEPLDLIRWNAGAAVFHAEQDCIARDGRFHVDLRATILRSVLQKVGDHSTHGHHA